MKVKVNHNGSCAGYVFKKDVAVELPEEVLAALGDDSYTEVKEKEVKPKMVKGAENKAVDVK